MNQAARVLVISKNANSQRLYEDAVMDAGMPHDSAGSLQDALLAATRNAYNGILIDLPTLIQADDREKEHLHDLIMAYPVAKLRSIPSRNRISLMCTGKCTASYATIEDFLTGECLRFEARTFRSTIRKNVNLPVVISPPGESGPEMGEMTFTVNISMGGAFVFTAGKWRTGDRIWIRPAYSTDHPAPIVGEVRWNIPWGRKFVVPGIGIRFLEITSEQEKEILFALG